VSCGRGELVIPARDNMRQPGLEGENWFVSDALHAQEELASARDHAEARDMARYVQMNVNRALWSDPGNDVIRAALVAALEGVGATDIATEVAVDLTDESYPSLASIAPPPASPTPTATPALPAAADLPKLPDVSPLCLDDAGCPLPAEILQGPPSKPAHAASCNVAAGASSTLAVVLPVLVFAGGLGFAARRRRRQR